jgi:hypothetical protein
VTSWLSLTDTFQNGDSFTEMRVGVFVTIFPTNDRHPRGGLVEDPDLSTVDSRSDTSGMTTISVNSITTQSSPLSTNTISV